MADVHVLLLGPPGAGKGTQSTRLAERFGLEHVTTGDALRANRDMETDYGKPREYMEAGELVPDPVVNEIVKVALEAADGYVLDGYPRNLEQAEYLDGITDLDVVVYLDVPREELVDRLTGRRVCPDCGRNYHVEYDPPAESGVCDDCGTALVQREDDQADVVTERLRVYEENTQPVVEHYDDRGVLQRVDGDRAPDAVWAELESAVSAAE
ncbi:MAG: adenylate kinase [Halobacteriales archaeon]|nr:adenylate kinase [Halobacteriales archaeon]